MFLKDLYIENFRGIGEGLTINFPNKVTTLIGPNCVGKTTILEAIDYLLSPDYLSSRISEYDFHKSANNITDTIKIVGKTHDVFFYEIETQSTIGQAVKLLIPCIGVSLTIKRRQLGTKILEDAFITNKTVIPLTSTYASVTYPTTTSSLRTPVDGKILEGKHIFTYKLSDGSNRSCNVFDFSLIFNPSKAKGFPKTLYLPIDREKEILGNYSLFSKILTDLHWRYLENGTNPRKEDAYNEFKNLLLDGFDEHSKLLGGINDSISEFIQGKDLSIEFINLNEPIKSAYFTRLEDSKYIDPKKLGSGLHMLLCYALFMYVAKKDKDPLILLIDEPEMHLHIDLHNKLFEDFQAQEKIQIIYATQSENFISLKNWKQIYLLSDKQFHPTESILNEEIISADGQTSKLFEYLDDYAEKNKHISLFIKDNLKFLFTTKCILVEGPAEIYAIPRLLELESVSKKHSISFINCWGKGKIKAYQLLCKAFNINYFTIYDEDPEEQKTTQENEKENASIISNSINEKIFGISSNFENVLGISGNNKFDKVVRYIDSLADTSTIPKEIKTLIWNLKNFIEESSN